MNAKTLHVMTTLEKAEFLFVLGQSHFSLALNYKTSLVFLFTVECEALKAVLVGLKSYDSNSVSRRTV